MKILSVDYGDARTGLACCDSSQTLASPVGVIHEKDIDKTAAKVMEAAKEQMAKKIIVGLPRNMDGSEGFRAQICHEFADKLRKLTQLPVEMWDERGTTVSAHNFLNQTNTRGKKRKAVVDAVAAVIILESYMSADRNRAIKNAALGGEGNA